MKQLNVLYTVNHNYIPYLLVSLYSLLENNTAIDIIVHIVCDSFEAEDYKKIESSINTFGANVYFYPFAEIKELIEESHLPCWRDTQIANARLFFQQYIKGVEKLLYLDADTIVVDSLSDLQKYDGLLHMVQDSMPKNYYQHLNIPLEKYCNSGVLWIDVHKWKEAKCDEKIREITKQIQTYTYPDQDVINMALQKEIQLLPPAYNLLSTDTYYDLFLLSRYYKRQNIERYSIKEMKEAKKNPIIFHSTPFYSQNPLDRNAAHPYRQIYTSYLDKIYNQSQQTISHNAIHSYLLKLYLYSSLLCPQTIKKGIKQFVKKI